MSLFNNKFNIVLASGSPRRKELLSEIIPEFDIIVSEADEDSIPKMLEPALYVQELAMLKAAASAKNVSSNKNSIVIGADTVVTLDGKILGKRLIRGLLKIVSRLMIPTMMDSKVFEKIFDAWNLATVASTVWGPDSDMAKNAQSAFYSILNSVDDDTKLEFFEGLERIKARPER